MSKAEQEAVRAVAEKHWPLDADGLRYNSRADEELIEAAPALEAARANGKKGGRPKKETQQKPSGFPKDNPAETQHEPSTKPPQSSDTSASLRSAEGRASRLPADWKPDDEMMNWAKAERPDLNIPKVLEKFHDHWKSASGKASKKLDWPATFRNWVRDERAPNRGQIAATGETAYQKSMRQRAQIMAPGIAAAAPGQEFDFLEEQTHVAVIAGR